LNKNLGIAKFERREKAVLCNICDHTGAETIVAMQSITIHTQFKHLGNQKRWYNT